MHLLYVAYFERKNKQKKRHNKQRIKYFLSSSVSGLLQNLFRGNDNLIIYYFLSSLGERAGV